MGRVVLKMSGSLHNKRGFTFIELMVAIFLIGIMAAVTIPYLRGDDPELVRNQFVEELNTFSSLVWYNAIVTGKVHKVVIDLQESQMFAEIQTDEKTGQGDPKYEPMQIDYSNSLFNWDNRKFEIKDIYVNNKSALFSGDGNSDKVWFFIMPDGLSQSVKINFYDVAEGKDFGESSDYSLVLNPFSVQFKIYETFQKPD